MRPTNTNACSGSKRHILIIIRYRLLLLLLLLPLLLLLHPFNDLFCRTTWVSRYQKGKTSLQDVNEARGNGVLG